MVPVDWSAYRRFFRLAFADAHTPRRRAALAGLALGLPSLAALNSACLWLDLALFPRLRRTRVGEIVFITGHARSGTTFLHQLLAADSARASYMRTWEMLLPSLLQRRVVHALGRLDARLGSPLDRRLEAWQDARFAKGRQMHPMHLKNPEEDGFLFLPTFLQAQIGILFPYLRELNRLFYMDRRPESVRLRALAFYEECVKRQLAADGPRPDGGGPRVYLSKTPSFVGMLRGLRAQFPEARFVIPMRSPFETIPSLLKMMLRNWRASGYTREQIDEALHLLSQQSLSYYSYPFEALAGLPEDRVAYVRYEELVEKPAATVRDLYRRFGWELSPAFEAALTAAQEGARSHWPEHRYSLEEFGLTAEGIREALPEAFGRFGWEEAG